MMANVERFRACWRVAFKTSLVFSRILDNEAISFGLRRGKGARVG